MSPVDTPTQANNRTAKTTQRRQDGVDHSVKAAPPPTRSTRTDQLESGDLGVRGRGVLLDRHTGRLQRLPSTPKEERCRLHHRSEFASLSTAPTAARRANPLSSTINRSNNWLHATDNKVINCRFHSTKHPHGDARSYRDSRGLLVLRRFKLGAQRGNRALVRLLRHLLAALHAVHAQADIANAGERPSNSVHSTSTASEDKGNPKRPDRSGSEATSPVQDRAAAMAERSAPGGDVGEFFLGQHQVGLELRLRKKVAPHITRTIFAHSIHNTHPTRLVTLRPRASAQRRLHPGITVGKQERQPRYVAKSSASNS